MASTAQANDHDEVRLLLGRINDAWLKGRPEDLASALNDCFHNDIVIKGPDFQELGRSKELCVKSYEDFLRQARCAIVSFPSRPLTCQVIQPWLPTPGR
jgi:hypothetical protein